VIVRGLVCAAVLVTLSSIGVAVGAGFPLVAEDVTIVRIPGAVPFKSCTVAPVADAFVDEALPDTAFGAEPYVEVAAGPSRRRALVRFDLDSCGVSAGAQVRTARLRMLLTAAPTESRTWRVRRVTSAWTEGAATWNAAPDVAASVTDAVETGVVLGDVLEWDVRGDVAQIVSGAVTDRGWRIADPDETAPVTVSGALASREAVDPAQRPSLTLTWFD